MESDYGEVSKRDWEDRRKIAKEQEVREWLDQATLRTDVTRSTHHIRTTAGGKLQAFISRACAIRGPKHQPAKTAWTEG